MEIVKIGEKTEKEQLAEQKTKNDRQKVTALSAQIKNPNRVNVFVNQKFVLSLDISQIVDEGVKVGLEIDGARLTELKQKSDFGKYYQRTLEYALTRPHSEREIRDYLRKKTFSTMKRIQTRSGEWKTIQKMGMDAGFIEPIIHKLKAKNYIDDYKFAKFWMENRNLKKGISARKMRMELLTKGVACDIMDSILAQSERADANEIEKIIAKKRAKYDDQKLMAYLVRQGFPYSEVKEAVLSGSATGSGPETD